MADDQIPREFFLEKTTKIVTAYVSKNPVSLNSLPELMGQVFESLENVSKNETPSMRPDPAVPIAKSITSDHIVCLEDGAKLKMLKRYLRTRYNLSPEEYRARWNLPSDYPMVAPEYAKRRSDFAKSIGLGKASAKGS